MLALLRQPPARRFGIFRQVMHATVEPLALDVKSRLLQDAFETDDVAVEPWSPNAVRPLAYAHDAQRPPDGIWCRDTALLRC